EGVPIEDVERVTDEEIARLISGGITEDELTRAKNRAEVDVAHQLENYDARADLIGMLSTFFGDPTLVDRWLDPYRRATVAQIANCARQYLVPENRVTIHFLPEAASASIGPRPLRPANRAPVGLRASGESPSPAVCVPSSPGTPT